MPQTTALIESEPLDGPPRANRRRLPEVRPSVTHHFRIANHEGYLIVGLYPNGSPGEIFIKMAKEGSTISLGGHPKAAIRYHLKTGHRE